MSGIAGFFNLDGRPADPALLRRMTDRMAHRGPDGVGHWTDGPVALGHRMLHTTPEALQEKQPLTNELGDLCLTLDGRVDNRDELRRELEARGFRLRTDTDAELVLRAYQCWGEACPAKIIGDFAFALWDRRKRHLFCARDPLGVKPFTYYCDGRTFVFGSELRPLFEEPSVRREPNEGMIGEYLAAAITSQEETLWQGILRLPPAYRLVVRTDGTLRKERYWDIDPEPETGYLRDDELAEHFRQVFQEAVRCRLRSQAPVGADLSGGLDSSSVVCVGRQLHRNGTIPENGFETFSVTFPGLHCDETPWIQDVVRMWDVKSNLVPWGPIEPSHYRNAALASLDFPGYPNGAGMSHGYHSLARSKGIRVLLSGVGGDDWLTGAPAHYARLLRGGACRALLREALSEARVSGVREAMITLARYGLAPLLPPRLELAGRAIVTAYRIPRSLDLRFARRIGLAQRLAAEAAATSRHGGSLIRWGPRSGWQVYAGEVEDRVAAALGLEQRHPFLDRRVVEAALRIRADWHWDSGRTKRLLRLAMRGILPEGVRTRTTKAHFSHLFVAAMREQGSDGGFECSAVTSPSWLHWRRTQTLYADMLARFAKADDRYVEHIWPLWMAWGIEIWLDAASNA